MKKIELVQVSVSDDYTNDVHRFEKSFESMDELFSFVNQQFMDCPRTASGYSLKYFENGEIKKQEYEFVMDETIYTVSVDSSL